MHCLKLIIRVVLVPATLFSCFRTVRGVPVQVYILDIFEPISMHDPKLLPSFIILKSMNVDWMISVPDADVHSDSTA